MSDIAGLGSVPSPALLFDADRIERNLDRMIEIAGGRPELLRPHIKTHKCREILELQTERGIRQVKCATIAEAELAALSGVPDVLIAYPLVGPNVARFAALIRAYPDTDFSCLADSGEALDRLEQSAVSASVFLDLDCGMHRTGIEPGDAAFEIVRRLKRSESLGFAGIHAYDGHIHDADPEIRRQRFDEAMRVVDQFLHRLVEQEIEVPLVISGGSPTFLLHADRVLSARRPWQASPGTPLLWDAGYSTNHPDLDFEPAALFLTRVVSKPGSGRLCLDLGHKAIAAENPIENRVRFPALSDVKFVSQSEEHLVIQCADSSRLPIGAELIGIPWHVCPSVALHDEAHVIRDGTVTGERWEIAARRRRLTI